MALPGGANRIDE